MNVAKSPFLSTRILPTPGIWVAMQSSGVSARPRVPQAPSRWMERSTTSKVSWMRLQSTTASCQWTSSSDITVLRMKKAYMKNMTNMNMASMNMNMNITILGDNMNMANILSEDH